MKHEHVTAESIYQKMLQHVAPLPSQAAYAHNLAAIFSMHVHRNELIDDGLSPDDLPAPSAIVVAPTGQGKTFLVRKMAECLDLNVIAIDCSTMAAEGWKGVALSERLATSKEELKDDEKFARSILFSTRWTKSGWQTRTIVGAIRWSTFCRCSTATRLPLNKIERLSLLTPAGLPFSLVVPLMGWRM